MSDEHFFGELAPVASLLDRPRQAQRSAATRRTATSQRSQRSTRTKQRTKSTPRPGARRIAPQSHEVTPNRGAPRRPQPSLPARAQQAETPQRRAAPSRPQGQNATGGLGQGHNKASGHSRRAQTEPLEAIAEPEQPRALVATAELRRRSVRGMMGSLGVVAVLATSLGVILVYAEVGGTRR